MSALTELRDGWDQAARENAMFNIVTTQTDWDPAEFFAYGQREIDLMLEHLSGLPVEQRRGRALDFGCGIGRLTQALAEHFKRVDGVDISPEMIDLAKAHNKHPGRVAYQLNTERLPFRSNAFDLVYSMIVLQHMPQPLAHGYVVEFIRVIRPTGVAVFEIPDCPDSWHSNGWLSMYGTSNETVKGWVDSAGGRVIDVEPINDGSFRYTAVRA